MDKKDHIIQVAFKLFSQNGIFSTSVDDIAKEAGVSKKTIYFQFRSKENLIKYTFGWKIQWISTQVDMVINKNLSALEKMSLYITVVCDAISDITMKVFCDLAQLKSLSTSAASEYLKQAVFIRFNKLLTQAKAEKLLKPEVDVGSTLMDYWNMLSPYLLMDLKNDVPYELKKADSLSGILKKQLLDLYSQILTQENGKKLNQLMINLDSANSTS